MPILTTLKEDNSVPVKIWTKDIEETALVQLSNLATLPFIHKHVAVMPDVHWGMGSTVGSVVPTIQAIVPAAVGVDIGCGMIAHKFAGIKAEDLPDSLAVIRAAIEAAVPHGRTDNGGLNDRGAWGKPLEASSKAWEWLWNDKRMVPLRATYDHLFRSHKNAWRHLGTLGTGNHFIELCLDTTGGVWLMLHSGSRGIGNAIGRHFTQLAKKEMEKWHIHLPDKDLAYLPEGSQYFDDYIAAVDWAQDYAATNRLLMMDAAKAAISPYIKGGYRVGETTDMAVNCHHNYVSIENHYGKNVYLTRKGAVRARKGDLGIIPGSMGARSFIVRGKGNEESFHSCSHGAGRRMSRGAAKKAFTEEDLRKQTEGVECRKDKDVIDEIPGAYKDIDQVMANQEDLVEIVHELKQVLCVKG